MLHTSKVHRTKICGVRDGKSLENTPGETLDDTTYEKHLEACGEEWDKDGTDHDYHASDHCLLVSDPFGNVSVDDETENTPNLFHVKMRLSNIRDRHT